MVKPIPPIKVVMSFLGKRRRLIGKGRETEEFARNYRELERKRIWQLIETISLDKTCNSYAQTHTGQIPSFIISQ